MWHYIYFLPLFRKNQSLDDSLPREKRLTLCNNIIHIKSVLNKDKNHYYCMIFL